MTVRNISPDELEAASRALIVARKTNLGIEVRMPVVYPTGESVTVVVAVQGGEYIVHDAGFGAMYLTSAGVALSDKLRERLNHLASQYGCEFIEGRMSRRCSVEQIALAMVMVANASRTVGDHVAEARRRPIASFKRELVEVVTNIYGSRVREDEEVRGKYGVVYHVNAVVLDQQESAIVSFIEAITDQNAVNRHFREFFDLSESEQYKSVPRFAVYDNRHGWRPGDIAILRAVSSQVIPYSDPQHATEQLAAIAA